MATQWHPYRTLGFLWSGPVFDIAQDQTAKRPGRRLVLVRSWLRPVFANRSLELDRKGKHGDVIRVLARTRQEWDYLKVWPGPRPN
jgi:hypothetical protein